MFSVTKNGTPFFHISYSSGDICERRQIEGMLVTFVRRFQILFDKKAEIQVCQISSLKFYLDFGVFKGVKRYLNKCAHFWQKAMSRHFQVLH